MCNSSQHLVANNQFNKAKKIGVPQCRVLQAFSNREIRYSAQNSFLIQNFEAQEQCIQKSNFK